MQQGGQGVGETIGICLNVLVGIPGWMLPLGFAGRVARIIFKHALQKWRGHAVAQAVEALRNKPEGRGFDFH
jgi:hypothetical protein